MDVGVSAAVKAGLVGTGDEVGVFVLLLLLQCRACTLLTFVLLSWVPTNIRVIPDSIIPVLTSKTDFVNIDRPLVPGAATALADRTPDATSRAAMRDARAAMKATMSLFL